MADICSRCVCTIMLISVGGYIRTVSGSTTSQHLTEKPTGLPAKLLTNDSGTYPAPVLAEVTSIHAEKKIQFEFAISKDSTHGCDSNRQISCEVFEDVVMTQCEKYYRKIQGFWYSNQDILEFKYDSIIIRQQVSYTYNDMRPEDRGISPQEVYDRTIGPAVLSGTLGKLNVSPCPSCNQTIDLTDLSDLLPYCDPYLSAEYIEGYPYCVSPCQYIRCGNGGTCFQAEGSAWKCECRIKQGVYYFGKNCKNFVDLPGLIMALIFVVVGVVLCVCCVCYRKRAMEKKRKASVRTGSD